ncbi:hypothetical protein LX36DRAFT_751302 [Colletotrichum falcatum]|nr:hypothetical protein LX36DRAFT_751302 [Colletotrichum falcatum]
MKTPVALLTLAAALAGAVDMTPYEPAADVEAGFADFLIGFYMTMENQTATDTFTDFWPANNLGELVYDGCSFPGAANILGMKQVMLPRNGDKILWNLIRNASVVEDTAGDKTYLAKIVVQTSYPAGNCSQTYGDARFTILKDEEGVPRLKPHSGSLSLYNLTVSPTESPTNIACTLS